jgi:hypothetical protein
MNDLAPVPIQDPTLAGFTAWVYAVMGVPQSVLPPDSIYLQLAYDTSVNLVYTGLKCVPNTSQGTPQSPSIYSICVYNLGGHILCSIAQDDPNADPPSTFWADLRDKLNMNVLSYGMVTSASDQGTSAGQQIPDQIANLTLMGLDMMKTPWGRMYVMIAGQWGTLWGIS